MTALRLFLVGLAVYLAASYGGIRAADGEVVYRTAEALAHEGSFAVEESLPWKGFGLARGTDGREYSIFGPAQALVAAPFVLVAEAMPEGWWDSVGFDVPKSHYVAGGLTAFTRDEPLEDVAPHASRFLVTLINAPIAALGLALFFLLAARVSGSRDAGLLAALWFGFGTLHLPYAGTFFSEPLATVFVIAAWLPLVGGRARTPTVLLLSALWIGLAVATHVTAVLLVPFVAAYALLGGPASIGPIEPRPRARELVRRAALFAAGLAPPLVALAFYNHARFGDWTETGRTVPGGWVYATWQAPWRGLAGLAWSLGKGALWYAPALALGALAWPRLARRDRALAWCAGLAVLARMGVIAARSDWHGGFGIGPRYLLLCGPLLALPLACLVADVLPRAGKAAWALAAFAALCTVQQVCFTVGEVFSFQHVRKWTAQSQGYDAFVDDRIHRAAEHAPLLHLFDRAYRGPFLLRDVPLSNAALSAVLGALAVAALLSIWRRAIARRGGDHSV